MRYIKVSRGFTASEIVAFSSIVLILLAAGFAACAPSKSMAAAREAETKSNLHEIRVALERYNTDHDHYPAYLLGGDREGWTNWYVRYGSVNTINMTENRVASNLLVRDALIEYNYLSSYPKNVFTDDPRGLISRTNIAESIELGDGDPRFGFKGCIMGQGLDDMNFFRGANHPGRFFWSQVETRRTLDKGNWMYVPDYFKTVYPITTDMYYLFGGMTEPGKDEVIKTWWPGNFFYKGTSDKLLGGGVIEVPNTNKAGPVNRYILGAYGDLGTEGLDVIRLVWFDTNGNRLSWQCPESYGDRCFDCGYELFRGSFGESGGLPEVFGGGSASQGPWIPYDGATGEPDRFQYGAPDGIPDGVILVVTNGVETWKEYTPPAED